MKVTIEIHGKKIYSFVDEIRKRVVIGQAQATQEVGKEVSDYIKNDLLSGQMLGMWSAAGMIRARNTTSLDEGDLKKAVFARAFSNESKGESHVTVGVAGDKTKQVAKWLIEGRTGPWIITHSEGKKALQMNFPGGDVGYTESVSHPGYESKDFLQAALEAYVDRFRELVKQRVQEILSKHHSYGQPRDPLGRWTK